MFNLLTHWLEASGFKVQERRRVMYTAVIYYVDTSSINITPSCQIDKQNRVCFVFLKHYENKLTKNIRPTDFTKYLVNVFKFTKYLVNVHKISEILVNSFYKKPYVLTKGPFVNYVSIFLAIFDQVSTLSKGLFNKISISLTY